jgi:hypothetical protein
MFEGTDRFRRSLKYLSNPSGVHRDFGGTDQVLVSGCAAAAKTRHHISARNAQLAQHTCNTTTGQPLYNSAKTIPMLYADEGAGATAVTIALKSNFTYLQESPRMTKTQQSRCSRALTDSAEA